MSISNDAILIVGLAINFAGVIFAVVNSRVRLEGKIIRLETLVEILMRKSDLPHRRTDDPTTTT